MNIFVFIQKDNGTINRNSLEALAGAQQFARATDAQVSAVCFGEVNDQLTEYDIQQVLSISDPGLNSYNPQLYCEAFNQVISAHHPDMVIFGHTYQTRDWVPRLSAKLDIPFVSDCIRIQNQNGLILTRQIYQGKINTDLKVEGSVLVSIQSGAYRLDSIVSGNTSVQQFEVNLDSVKCTVHPGEKFQESKGSVDLSRAKIIVAVGRGIGKEENMPIAKELAEVLGAELGSSRPVVDYGWLPHEHQVGSSGQTVSPKLYLALGISGAIQHQVGMKGSSNIVAINKDGNAPIFEIADYGIVADLFEIVPKITQTLKDHKG
ncbi:MAG: electron transfer flavoprotein subunit alpha/FixB family protein [Candidatus Marinimicrobia bacterium]|nr:electron transfer flavoprotein subunit alpha/FixB family protein [Candidatus Neomarinimicrobiota bacterium]